MSGAFGVGCDAARRDWSTCVSDRCHNGFYCTSKRQCEPILDSGAWDAGQGDASQGQGQGQGIDGAPAQALLDGSSVDLSSSVDASDDVPLPAASVDGSAQLDSATEAGRTVVDTGAVDAYVPDAPGTCAGDNDCTGKGAPYCVQGQCVSCKSGDQCSGGAPVCSVSHVCVSCALVDAGCPTATPACEADSGRCVECLGDGDCVRDATKSFCQAGVCVGCAGAGASACAGRNPAKPVCMPGGTCVECATSDDCKAAAAKPICDTSVNVCVACTSDAQCSGKSGPGVCMFQQDGHCSTDAESVYVGKSAAGTCSDSGASAGSAQMPYCTTQKAMEAAKPVVVVMGQVQGPLAVGALSASLTVVGRSGIITPVDYADGITITGGELYLRALTVAGNPSGVTGIGVNAQAATGATVVLHMDGCTIKDNPGGGILLAGASFDIRNSVVSGNGPGQTAGGTVWGGIRVESLPAGGQASLNLMTIQKNLATGLTCSGAVQGQGVLASGNTPLDIATSCGAVSCATPSSTCGAQP
jgi:hypothetical protein